MKKSQKILLCSAAILMASGLTLACWGFRALQMQRAALAKGFERKALMLAQLREAEHKLSALQPSDVGGPNSKKAKSPSLPISARAAFDAQAKARTELLANDPQLQAIYFRSKRAEVSASHLPLFRELQLSPGQVKSLEDLLVKQEENQHDFAAVKQTLGLNRRDPTLLQAQAEAEADLQRQQTDLLGSAGYAQFQEYERKLPAREFVKTLAGTAAVDGILFSPDQVSQLVDAIAESSAGYREGGTAQVGANDWVNIDTKAATFLPPDQLWFFTHAEPTATSGFSRYEDVQSEIVHLLENLPDYDAVAPAPVDPPARP
jgi:hypothetical protein